MSGFTKLDSSLIASSVWSEPDKTRIVWITLLAMADRNGDVKASIVGLAHQAREPLEDTMKAIETLSMPDPFSGRKEMEGRRILPIEGGWHLVTHSHYRNSLRIEEKREQTRKRVRKYRGRSVTQRYAALPSASASVSVHSSNKKCSQKEAEEFCRSLGLPRSDGAAMWLHWEEKGWAKVKDWKLTIRKWQSFGYLPSQKNKKNGATTSTPKPEPKPQPEGWDDWLASTYPDAIQRDYWKVPADVQREFQRR